MQKDKEEWVKEFKARLYRFVLKLIKLLDSLPKERICFVIGDQLLRSGTSILGNYIEALSSSSSKEFARYFDNALRSINESKLWVALLRDSGRLTNEEVEWFLRELTEFGNIFASSVITVKKKGK